MMLHISDSELSMCIISANLDGVICLRIYASRSCFIWVISWARCCFSCIRCLPTRQPRGASYSSTYFIGTSWSLIWLMFGAGLSIKLSHERPLSNQQSKTSLPFTSCGALALYASGSKSSTDSSNHASEPYSLNTSATWLMIAELVNVRSVPL